MPLPAGASPPCGLDLRFTLATRAARQNSLVRTTELKQCRALSTGQARYFGQVRQRDWEASFLRTGALLAPKVRPYSSLWQRHRRCGATSPTSERSHSQTLVVAPDLCYLLRTGLWRYIQLSFTASKTALRSGE